MLYNCTVQEDSQFYLTLWANQICVIILKNFVTSGQKYEYNEKFTFGTSNIFVV